jgi:hypothetical protein
MFARSLDLATPNSKQIHKQVSIAISHLFQLQRMIALYPDIVLCGTYNS